MVRRLTLLAAARPRARRLRRRRRERRHDRRGDDAGCDDRGDRRLRPEVGLVTDIGGLDDRSFNFLANLGLERAEEELGVDGRVLISKADADYVPNLTSLAKARTTTSWSRSAS